MHEDLLDYSILLSPISPRSDRDETRFAIDHTKLRDHIPELRQKYECAIWSDEDGLDFDVVLAGSNPAEHEIQIIELAGTGISMTSIARQLGFSTSKVSRVLKKWREGHRPADGDEERA